MNSFANQQIIFIIGHFNYIASQKANNHINLKIMRYYTTILLIIFALSGYSQSDINQLVMTDFTVEVNGNSVKLDTTINVTLFPEVTRDIQIYKTTFVTYGIEFTYKFKGRRIKLIRRSYAQMADGYRKYAKIRKDMQELKVSVPGEVSGVSSESILYDKGTMSSIFVSFKYVFKYK